MSSLDRNQLHTLNEAEEVLEDAAALLILSETDEEFSALREETIRQIIELGEPKVFLAYQKKWDAAAEIIVPLVHQAQIANGIEPYTPEQYERNR